jgi:hypothetical protein
MKKIVKKMQTGGVAKPKVGAKKAAPKKLEPTYKNLTMGVSIEDEEARGYRSKQVNPTGLDSAIYREGYRRGLAGQEGTPNERALIKMGRWEGQNTKKNTSKSAPKKKMQAGGVMTPSKRVGPIDPKGAYTKVQERTIAGKKAPKVPLKKDKQLGATKMKKGGVIKKK